MRRLYHAAGITLVAMLLSGCSIGSLFQQNAHPKHDAGLTGGSVDSNQVHESPPSIPDAPPIVLTVPVVYVHADLVGDARATTNSGSLQIKAPSTLKGLVAYYNVGGYLFLGPVGWQPTNAIISEDNGVALTLTDPADPHQQAVFNLTQACVGCAVDSAASLFPAASAMATDYGGGAAPMSTQGYQVVSIRSGVKAFSKPVAAQLETDGIGYWKNPVPFDECSLTLPVSSHLLATVILNQFMADWMRG